MGPLRVDQQLCKVGLHHCASMGFALLWQFGGVSILAPLTAAQGGRRRAAKALFVVRRESADVDESVLQRDIGHGRCLALPGGKL